MALSMAGSAIATAAPIIDGYRSLEELTGGDPSTLVYRAVRNPDGTSSC